MSKPNLSFIGSGRIAHHHARAALAAGFSLGSVAASPGSTTAKEFGSLYGFEKYEQDPRDLIASGDWDAILLCTSPETLAELVEMAVEKGRPVLVEKPVALQSQGFDVFYGRKLEQVVVAFNRRYYSAIARAKAFIDENRPVLLEVITPEQIDLRNPERFSRYKGVFGNSVHMFDLARFLVGPIDLASIERVRSADGPLAAAALGKTGFGDVVIFKENWNSADNSTLILEARGQRMLIQPLERGQVFEGMQVVEPTQEMPLRQYRPQSREIIESDFVDIDFKPGFLAQLLDFRSLVEHGQRSPQMASIWDAHEAIRLAEQLVGFEVS